MGPNRELATWLLAHRREIEAAMNERLGPAAPRASGPEAETLRRFRTFAATALTRGQAQPPALDGLRPNERRVMALLGAWMGTAAELAGDRGEVVRSALSPLVDQFKLTLRTSRTGRQSKGAPRASRRAVSAAIDRIADAFVAVDVAEGRIVDANPAAGALLGVERDALLGLELMAFVPPPEQAGLWTRLDAVAEGGDGARFPMALQDKDGIPIHLETTASHFPSRGQTLALMLMRPCAVPRSSALADVVRALRPG